MSLKVVFFAKVHDRQVLERTEFYAVDIRILQELGYEVQIVTDPLRIPSADLYYVWWWTWAFFPLLNAAVQQSPVIIVGTFDHILPNGSLESFPHRPFWHQWMIRQSLWRAEANVFVSKIEFNRLLQEFQINNPYQSYHAVDGNIYKPVFTPKEKFFLSVCWMDKQNPIRKCLPETIHATVKLHKIYPEYKLVICGEKLEGYPPLAQLVSDLGAEEYIQFLGPVSQKEKIDLMQRCAVYFQPTRVEGFGLAIAEAMACGAPVVTSPVGSVPEVVGDIGAMALGTDPQSIVEAAHTILSNPNHAQWLSHEGSKRISTIFTYERRKAELQQIIQRHSRRSS